MYKRQARDSILGSVLGAAAVKALMNGEKGALAGMKNGEVRILPYEEAAKEATAQANDYLESNR